ncbi:hypothetical protein B4096_0959 [Heyndrickxia coagulans]|uniref:Uncharacterized protein n=1 Tax=Heyndrickxia coagulans TaxID=1398 RepID=A0A150K8Q2_HEYCO|nr:hypothetical protein BCO26_0293 [Heyndrickxia coagulans 2-6]KYC65776.1 hypothetical protein B4098_0993 [Heyndrickxia coagulans]KYC73211.1 hypothetical protein B4096_0959 [Heyndrickxia coagulans]
MMCAFRFFALEVTPAFGSGSYRLVRSWIEKLRFLRLLFVK